MKIAFFNAVQFNSIISGRSKQLAQEMGKLGHQVWFVEMPALRNLRFPPMQVRRQGMVDIVTLPPFPRSHQLMSTFIGKVWRIISSWFLKKSLGPFEHMHAIVSTPWWVEIVKGLPFKSLSYDYIDHISVHCPNGKYLETMREWETKLLMQCNNIFAVNERMNNRFQNENTKNFHIISNGVPEYWLKLRVPTSPQNKTRPQVGFIGALYEWIDQDLIVKIATMLPRMDFIFIGPTRRGVSVDRLLQIPNIQLKSPISFEKIPEYIEGFDVCLIPFKQDEVSDYADPIKLYEYLALGKPVVSTVKFNLMAPIYIGETYDEFVKGILKALGEKDRGADYFKFAQNNTWTKKAKMVISVLNHSNEHHE